MLAWALSPELVRARQELNSEYDRVQQALAGLTAPVQASEVDRLHALLRDLRESRARLVVQGRGTSPRLAALQYPQPLDLAGVQQALDPGTVLLSYRVGADRTLLFVVHGETKAARVPRPMTIHQLPVGRQALRERNHGRAARHRAAGRSHRAVFFGSRRSRTATLRRA